LLRRSEPGAPNIHPGFIFERRKFTRARHELSEAEKASLAKKMGKATLEAIIEEARLCSMGPSCCSRTSPFGHDQDRQRAIFGDAEATETAAMGLATHRLEHLIDCGDNRGETCTDRENLPPSITVFAAASLTNALQRRSRARR
jgi:hypothetical protein